MAISKDGNYLYMAGFRHDNITNRMGYFFFKSALSENGMITNFEDVDFNENSGNIQSMEISPNGKYLYLVEYNSPYRILQFEITSNGDLSYISSYTTGSRSPTSLVFTPDAKRAYVANSNYIEIFDYDESDGSFTHKDIAYTGTTELAANYPLKIAINTNGTYLYCGVDTACISYTIDAETGLLTNNGKYPPNPKSSWNHSYVTTSKNSEFVYTSDGYIYKQNSDGSLTRISYSGCSSEMDCIFAPDL